MQKKHSNLERETLGIFWHIIWHKNRRLFLLSLVHFFSAIFISVLLPLLVSMTLANIAMQRTDLANNLMSIIVVAILGVTSNLVGFTAVTRMDASGRYDVLSLAMDTLLRRSVGFHTNNIGGKLVNNALDYPNAYGSLITTTYVSMVPFILTMVIGISVVFSYSKILGLALLGITLFILTLIFFDSRRRSGVRRERKQAQNLMIANLSDTVVNAQAVKTFAREDTELAKHYKLARHLRTLQLRDWTHSSVAGSGRMAVLITMQISFIALIAHLVHHDPAILGIGIFSFIYTITLTSKLFEVGTLVRNIEEAFLQASSMTEIILEETEIADVPGAKSLHVDKGEITLSTVHFAYHDHAKEENVFSDLSLVIPAGQKIGLVGPSGGGKSTLTRLLLRFDDIDQGSITIDGQDIRHITQTSLRQAISYVPQEPLLFHRSILENIRYGRPDANLDEVKRAAKLAFADDFIEKLPDAYDTIVGERGVKLSGGQRQRVAIARAILKDAPILVLDEATSALDSESEVYIQKALEQLMKGRTTLVIAHRLSTIQKMDRILVLNDGVIEEDGSHTDLLAGNKLYAKLWRHQSGGFIEE
jgi:ATP-binding cassette subfamily B protein